MTKERQFKEIALSINLNKMRGEPCDYVRKILIGGGEIWSEAMRLEYV